MSGDGWGLIVAALIASVPSTLAWWSSRKTAKRIKTNHGMTIGEHVEALGALLAEHTIQDAANFAELRRLVREDHD